MSVHWLNFLPECNFHKARPLCELALLFKCISHGQNIEECVTKWLWLLPKCFSSHCVWRKLFCSNKKTWNGDFVACLKTDLRHCFYASGACVMYPGDHKKSGFSKNFGSSGNTVSGRTGIWHCFGSLRIFLWDMYKVFYLPFNHWRLTWLNDGKLKY